MKKNIRLILLASLLLVSASCKKDWLNEKRDSALLVPTTLKDLRFLLNNNFPAGNNPIGLAQVASDEYTIADNYYGSLYFVEQLGYIWSDKTLSTVNYIPEWDDNYQMVLVANVILDGLSKITPDNGNKVEYNDLKGGALFLRARAFYSLSQIFAKPYDPATAASDLGIPLRLSPDINEKSVRSTVKDTYDRITADLKEAAGLLKVTALYKTDSSRPAAYGLLARCYLSMRMYDLALQYADLSLKDNSKLVDYNTITLGSTYPVPPYNDEVIFHAPIPNYASFRKPTNAIDPVLYSSYDNNDLRQQLFFIQNADGTHAFRGSYTGSSQLFGGIATDEQYLIRSECAARAGKVTEAIADLNTLLKMRYKSGTFTPYTISDKTAALALILQERRKELLMRALRWSDLRRLNKENGFEVTIKKTVSGQTYTLPPNDPHYTFLIPQYIINASGMQQNPR